MDQVSGSVEQRAAVVAWIDERLARLDAACLRAARASGRGDLEAWLGDRTVRLARLEGVLVDEWRTLTRAGGPVDRLVALDRGLELVGVEGVGEGGCGRG